VFIKETTDLPTEGIAHAVINPPDLELPRFRCYLFFKYEDPTRQHYGRVQSWCMQDLRKFWYTMDKDYSRAASRVAISQLKDEINFLRDPTQAVERFRILVSDQEIAKAFLGTVHAGTGSAEERFERILRLIMIENGGCVL